MKSVITVIGEDSVGIIAQVSDLLAKNNVNIIDITQTTSDNRFLMVMIVDLSGALCSFSDLSSSLKELGEKIGQRIQMRHKKVYDSMHRI